MHNTINRALESAHLKRANKNRTAFPHADYRSASSYTRMRGHDFDTSFAIFPLLKTNLLTI